MEEEVAKEIGASSIIPILQNLATPLMAEINMCKVL
jgi:hypothetical protein